MTGIRTGLVACMVWAAAAVGVAGEHAVVPIGGKAAAVKVVPLPGVTVSLETIAQAEGEPPCVRVTFAKTGAERRLVAVEAAVVKAPVGLRALSARCQLCLKQGGEARLALVAFERDGGAWFKISASPLPVDKLTEVRLPLGSFRKAAFGRDDDEQVQWEQVEKVWLGLTLDGPAEGRLDLSRAVLTTEPYRPTGPLHVTNGSPGTWGASNDRAASVKITTPPEGPGDKPCMRVDFSFPGGRHMYVVPSTRLGEVELEGYKALRFTYKAVLPKGIDGLLVMLIERDGTQYYADPAPPRAGEWKTITIPFEKLERGTWSKDENDRLDLNDIRSVAVGLHGTTTETQGKGSIWVADVQFVP